MPTSTERLPLAMELTEIRTKLVRGTHDKLRAFATITLDDALAIRDLKIIEGAQRLFVAVQQWQH